MNACQERTFFSCVDNPDDSNIMKVSNDTLRGDAMVYTNYRIESLAEVKTYLDRLKYAIKNGTQIRLQKLRNVDNCKPVQYTNEYALNMLFPDENPVDALKRELLRLEPQHYLRTVKDIRFPNRSEMREFGVVYPINQEVYIKIRTELCTSGGHDVFVMSYHFAEIPFVKETFPYR